MARTRTGTSEADRVDDHDPGAATVTDVVPEPAPAAKPVPAGMLKIDIHAKHHGVDKDGAPTTLPPGTYVMPKDEAMHYVKTGVAKVVGA